MKYLAAAMKHLGDAGVMKHIADVGDATAATIAVGAVLGFLPAIAAVFTIVWTGIRIYEWWNGRHTKE